MKTVGIITSEAAISEEKYISDEKIQSLLHSESYEDKRLGRVFLLKKYRIILDKSKDNWCGDYSKYSVDLEVVEQYSPIILPKFTEEGAPISGFVIEKLLIDD